VIPSAILGRYASSLADIVFEDNIVERVTEDLETYSAIFKAVPDLLETFHSPSVPREAKGKLLDELLAQYPAAPVAANFLRILLEHNRIRYFHLILEGFLKSVNERVGIVSARITAAAPLSQQEQSLLEQRLAGITGKPTNLEFQTDEGLLGGIVIQIGSTVFDGSIRTQLADMKRRLAET
jgi:F-type H+-transporting ATPase subunit delta